MLGRGSWARDDSSVPPFPDPGRGGRGVRSVAMSGCQESDAYPELFYKASVRTLAGTQGQAELVNGGQWCYHAGGPSRPRCTAARRSRDRAGWGSTVVPILAGQLGPRSSRLSPWLATPPEPGARVHGVGALKGAAR